MIGPVVRITPPRIAKKSRKGLKQKKGAKLKSTVGAIEKLIESFDLLKSLPQASVGITFGQLVRCDTDGLKADLQKIFTGRIRNNVLNMDFDSVPRHHQVVHMYAYS